MTKVYLRLNPPNFGLQAGRYDIWENLSVEEFIEALRDPLAEDEISLTFLEGWNIFDIDKELMSKNLINQWEFTDYVRNCESWFCELKSDFAFISDSETLEGFLYPDTYSINPNTFSPEILARKMLKNFQTKIIDSKIISNTSNTEILDTVMMASIVQKEANKADNPEEIAIIAGILKKRLIEWLQIGADATVCYAHDVATQDCDPEAVLRYLYDDNPYNTRVISWAPAGAIANPEDVIIEATVNSIESPYYYYLHDNSGKIHYASTNAEHEGNKLMHLR